MKNIISNIFRRNTSKIGKKEGQAELRPGDKFILTNENKDIIYDVHYISIPKHLKVEDQRS